MVADTAGTPPDWRELISEDAWRDAYHAFHMALDSPRGGTGVGLMAFFDSLVESGILRIEYRTTGNSLEDAVAENTMWSVEPERCEQRLVSEWTETP